MLQICGKTSLQGEVRIGGAKNSALAILVGALLCPGDCRIRNVPSIIDVTQMGEILSSLGVAWQQHGDIVDINARYINQSQVPSKLVSQWRASFLAIGPLLARLGAVRIPLPGGCAIGTRAVDLHLRGLQAMGARIQGAGTKTIIISGVSKLHSADHSIISDRIEAGTFLVAAAMTRSRLSVTSVNPHYLTIEEERMFKI